MTLKEPNCVGSSQSPIQLEINGVTTVHNPFRFLYRVTVLLLALFQSGCAGITSRYSAPAIVGQPATAINAAPGPAAVGVMFNVPTYGFNVLAGSARTISIRITNGTTSLVNWTISSTTGGASAALSASANAVPVVTATFGSA